MKHALPWVGLGISVALNLGIGTVAWADQPLSVVYPPDGHETTAAQIFLIGTAPAGSEVTVNGQPIQRSPAGHFAPSVPLQVGENLFTLRYQNQTLTLRVNRTTATAPAPVGVAFAAESLLPAVEIQRLPNEPICLSAIAPSQANVQATLAGQTVALLPQATAVDLPSNSAVLTFSNQPVGPETGATLYSGATLYQGCTTFGTPGKLGLPEFQLTLNGQTVRQPGTGQISILAPAQPTVVEVTAASGTARSGPSTDYSRLTPLPQGTRASVTGQEGEWLRLDYGGWIRTADTQVVPRVGAPRTLIRSLQARTRGDWTEIAFPLQVPVPVTVDQGNRSFTLTLHNTTAQTDTILLNDDPVIERLDWQQTAPGQVQYRFNLKSAQQWGYKLRYDGTTLVLSLKHPPRIVNRDRPLTGMRILIDPGHGGPEDLGARGPTGFPEKEVALTVSRLLRQQLEARGATVLMTRDADIDLWPQDRAAMIDQLEPTLALSVHYNALPDDGDAVNTAGIGTFWYNAQAHSLSVFLHNSLVAQLDRPSYGVFWNNLALTRPTVAPSVLLELGFMINPTEFEWIVNPTEQERLAAALAEGVTRWIEQAVPTDD